MFVCLLVWTGPPCSGLLSRYVSFAWAMRTIALLNVLFCPLCFYIESKDSVESEVQVKMSDTNSYIFSVKCYEQQTKFLKAVPEARHINAYLFMFTQIQNYLNECACTQNCINSAIVAKITSSKIHILCIFFSGCWQQNGGCLKRV